MTDSRAKLCTAPIGANVFPCRDHRISARSAPPYDSLVDDLNDEQMMGPRLEIVNAAYFLSLALLHEDMTDNIKKYSARESTSHKIRSMQF